MSREKLHREVFAEAIAVGPIKTIGEALFSYSGVTSSVYLDFPSTEAKVRSTEAHYHNISCIYKTNSSYQETPGWPREIRLG